MPEINNNEPSKRNPSSSSEEDPDIDVPMLMELLEKDGEEIFCVKLNNTNMDKLILYAIFEFLKTSQNLKHFSLSGAHINDEKMEPLVAALKENKVLESLNLESNDITNLTLEPLLEVLTTHPNIRELKLTHQKHGLGSRGEEALSKLLDKNPNMMKVAYPFNVPASRSLADRCHIRNQDMQRRKKSVGEEFYNYMENIKKRDAHPQPWVKIKESSEEKDAKFKRSLSDKKGKLTRTKTVDIQADNRRRAIERAKPVVDDELASKLKGARLRRSKTVAYT